jgi:hypothetical protein
MKSINLQVQGVQSYPCRKNTKKATKGNITIKLPKTSGKRKHLKCSHWKDPLYVGLRHDWQHSSS